MPGVALQDRFISPGDLELGLTPEKAGILARTRPAQWLFRCIYAPGAAVRRESALPAHEAFIRAHLDEIRFAGPLFANDGLSRTGTWFLADAPDRAGAEALIAAEGFNRAGLFSVIEIHRFIETSPCERRQINMAADPDLQMFLCEILYAADAAGTRLERAPAEQCRTKVRGRCIIRGPMLSDDGSRIVGESCIIEVEDLAAAELLMSALPLARAGALEEVRIDRWRFGATIG